MTDISSLVGGLLLPQGLLLAISSGGWVPPIEADVYVRVFGDEPVTPEFYDVAEIRKHNLSWQAMREDNVFIGGWVPSCLRIDPKQSVVIGSLGPDMPIVLDYRESREAPRVLYIWGDEAPRWIEVAPDFDSFLDRLYPQQL